MHPSAIVEPGAVLGTGTRVWHFCHVMSGARIGRDCAFGQNCFIAGGVVIGDRVKVQNNVSIYDGVEIEDDVFLGPSMVFTNVKHPRSEVSRKHQFASTRVRRGATIGANATVVCGVTLGEYCFVGAGAVVTKPVPDHALVVGVPAEIVGWVSRHGEPLQFDDAGAAICMQTGQRYLRTEHGVTLEDASRG